MTKMGNSGNTDGIAFKPFINTKQRELEELRAKWEVEFDLELEVSTFTRLIQRDVNNYIAVKPNGKLKLKGGAIGQAIKRDPTKASKPTIIDYMLVQKLVYNREFKEMVTELEPINYTFTLKSMKSSTQTGKMITSDGKVLPNEVNRVYASKSGTQILKQKVEGYENAKFPDTPAYMSIANEKLTDLPNIDYEYYIELAEKKLQSWVA